MNVDHPVRHNTRASKVCLAHNIWNDDQRTKDGARQSSIFVDGRCKRPDGPEKLVCFEQSIQQCQPALYQRASVAVGRRISCRSQRKYCSGDSPCSRGSSEPAACTASPRGHGLHRQCSKRVWHRVSTDLRCWKLLEESTHNAAVSVRASLGLAMEPCRSQWATHDASLHNGVGSVVVKAANTPSRVAHQQLR